MRLVDFQLSVRPAGISAEHERRINEGLFPVYEALHLWLKEQKVPAPFRKVVVSLADRKISERWHGKPVVVLGICEVTESITLDDAAMLSGTHDWTCHRVLDALEHIHSSVGWHSEELESFVRQVAGRKPPCSHRFSRLKKQEKGGLACDVLLEAGIGSTAVKVQFTADEKVASEVVVASRAGPLFIEDDFPVVATKIEEGQFILIGRDR